LVGSESTREAEEGYGAVTSSAAESLKVKENGKEEEEEEGTKEGYLAADADAAT
jgi:hypothetical protein